MTEFDVYSQQPLVIDNGSGIIKAGLAGEQKPTCVFQSCFGRPKYSRVMMGSLEGDIFVGEKMNLHRGLLKLSYPMEHGIVQDWDGMEHLWRHIYSKDQLKLSSDDHPVLLTEAALNPLSHREKMASTFNSPALMISMQAVLSLYATGRTTGVVIDCGDGLSHAVPIYEGFALQHSIVRSDIGGRDVTRFLKFLLRREGHNFYTTSEIETIRTMKEKACFVSQNPLKDDFSHFIDKVKYNLPDGTTIELGPCRIQSPEILFRPELIGSECEGVHQVLLDSVNKSDLDLRLTLYSNMVLSGGTTLFRGFGDRLLSELKKQAPKDIKLRITAPSERMFATWMGGSILASLDTFKRLWVSRAEYNEEGARILLRKIF